MAKPAPPRRPTVRGTNLFREIDLPGAGSGLPVSYWDLWFVVVLFNQFGGDWTQLIDHFRRKVRAGFGEYDAERLFSHAVQLRIHLEQAGLPAEAVLGEEATALLKSERRRAVKNVLENAPHYRQLSEAMVHTPRRVRKGRALRGYWDRFPVSPDRYAGDLTRLYKTSGYYTERQSFGLEHKLSDFIKKRVQGLTLAGEVALYRASLTVILEKMDIVDDSGGVIGYLYEQLFTHYAGLPRPEPGMTPADFLQDLLELLLWENYGLTNNAQSAFFAGLSPAEADLAEAILRQQWRELDDLDLVYRSEEALTMLGLLCTQQDRFDRFIDLARAMGTRKWQRVSRMSERAEQAGRFDLAVAVYEAALQPGMHERYLRKKYEALKERIEANQ